MDAEPPIQLTHGDYKVGWICALPKEQTAALYMLETRHSDLTNPANDHNTYFLGSIKQHNIVIACLPKGRVGNNDSAAVAIRMEATFPNIKFGLMVGIGGGVPPKVRLGDVVVSCASHGYPGVIQWDMGKAEHGGRFSRLGCLDTPPIVLLTAISKLEADEAVCRANMLKYIADFKSRNSSFITSDILKDELYRSSYCHVSRNDSWEEELEAREEGCHFCDKSQILKRPQRKHDMMIHYGLIASGNQVVKDAQYRDKLNGDFSGKLLCLEMEAAGLMTAFPCIIIRGICDYADSHKNDVWQEHAAVVAAAYAKALLGVIPVSSLQITSTIKDIFPTFLKPARDVTPTYGFKKSQAKDTFHKLGFDILRKSTQLFKDKRRNEVINQWLIQEANEKSNQLVQLQTELASVESELQQLEIKRKALLEHQNKTEQTICYLDQGVQDIEEDQTQITKEWAATQRQLDESLHIDGSDRKYESEFANTKSWRLLQWAIEKDHVEMVKLLLDDNIDMVAPDDGGWNPLIAASRNGQVDIVRLLLDTGKLDIDLEGNDGYTALRWAIERRHENAAHLLLERGAKMCIQTFNGHTDWVNSVAISHTTNLIASASWDDTIKLWDFATSQCRRTLEGHTGSVFAVAFSQGSKLIASGSHDETIKIWGAATGCCQKTLGGHTGIVYTVAFSHDSKTVASGSHDQTIKIWNLATGYCLQTLEGHTGIVYTVTFSHDSKLIASTSSDTTVKLWDAVTGNCQQTLEGHNGQVYSVAFSHDSNLIASSSEDYTIKIWNVTTGQCQHTLTGHCGFVISVKFSHDSKMLASASADGTLKLWDSATGQCLQTLRGHAEGVMSVAFSHDSSFVLSASSDKTIKLWSTAMASSSLVGRMAR